MSVRKKIDTSHPDCVDYTMKFLKIMDDYHAREKQEEAKYPDYPCGRDHRVDRAMAPIWRESCRKIKELQMQYSYLFSEVEVADESEPYHDEEASRFFDAILEMRRRASHPERWRQGDGQSEK